MEHNIRIVGDEPEEGDVEDSVHVVEAPDPEDDQLGLDGLTVTHADGGVTVSLNGKPLVGDGVAGAAKAPKKWFANLVEDIDDSVLGTIADDLLRGIDDDLTSRAGWLDDRAQGIRLLGLKIEQQGNSGAADGAPLEGMSKVRHPLLLEAVLRFQANARSELLPTDGPVKVRDDGQSTVERDSMADYLQRDMNHYLTSTAMEYYPDTDRMLLMLGFGGSAFKKVFYCPLRQRPVSDSVDAKDLIVNNEAVSLETAKRVTHAISMKASTVRRMQIIGAYKDVNLATPMARDTDAVDDEKASQQGIDTSAANPEDRDRQIYETYCELDIPGLEHKVKGEVTGLEIPYIVTIDRTSREILAIVRNYNEDTQELPETRKTFVKYQFVPGLGFYDIGLLHILGNTTMAVTAAWREALDAGMFANFPGFLFARQGARQDTTQFRVPPGGGAPVDTGGMPINQAVMPLPYKEAGPGMMQLIENMVETGQRVGSTSELQVGEGRSDAPVGTTLALIEQAMKILNAVHKRMHTAQDLEFKLLVECFRQHPESFWKANKRPATQWDQDMFLAAINDYDLVPKADPNTASHSQRILKVTGLKQLAASSPDLYDMQKVDTAVLSTMGWSNPAQFFKTPDELSQPSPVIIKGMADMKVDQQKADADTMKAQAAMIKAGQPPAGVAAQPEDPAKQQMVQLKSADLLLKARKMDADVEREEQQDMRAAMQDENRDKDRVADLTMEQMRLEKEREDDARDHEHAARESQAEQHHERTMEAVRLAHEVMMAKRQQENDLKLVKARPHGGNK